ncbi:hypothetical protein ACFQZ4_21795 [Catellatospora coxensis]
MRSPSWARASAWCRQATAASAQCGASRHAATSGIARSGPSCEASSPVATVMSICVRSGSGRPPPYAIQASMNACVPVSALPRRSSTIRVSGPGEPPSSTSAPAAVAAVAATNGIGAAPIAGARWVTAGVSSCAGASRAACTSGATAASAEFTSWPRTSWWNR